jgi:hypothetical protein
MTNTYNYDEMIFKNKQFNKISSIVVNHWNHSAVHYRSGHECGSGWMIQPGSQDFGYAGVQLQSNIIKLVIDRDQ